MVTVNQRVQVVGLITLATAWGLASVGGMPQAVAMPLKDAIATDYSPADYNPPAKYYIRGGLFAYSPNLQINVRSGPGTHYYARHYGLPGDRVTLMNEAIGNDGYRWWYLKFNESGARGWVRADFVAIPD